MRVLSALCVAVAAYLSAHTHSAAHMHQDTAAHASIAVGQAGYLPSFPKHARVVASSPARGFEVRADGSGTVVHSGMLSGARLDADTGQMVQLADFSSVRAPGHYRIHVPGVGESWPFAISSSAFERPLYLTMRSYFGQRCGTEVDLLPAFVGYRYAVCHRDGRYDPSSGRTGPAPSVKGWHDAGDYGRYMVTSGITTGMLLLAAELYPARLHALRLDIPESGDGVPDVLDEIRWNLDWMLSMQHTDGGVWHKQTSAHFAGMLLPDADTLPSLVVGTGRAPYTSTCATAQFAAATAAAARALHPFDRRYAETLLVAARRAWAWTERHPNETFSNSGAITTGEYGDSECGDDRLWAAVELWRTTHEPAFSSVVDAMAPAHIAALRSTSPPSWAQVGGLALWSYALDARSTGALGDDVRRRAIEAARAVAARVRSHVSRQPLTTGDYVWGSNGVAATYGVQLLVAHRLSRDDELMEAALDSLHYLLGRNTFSLSWVTRVGANAVRHPHHRPSAGDAQVEPWPGLLAGGPNQRRQDPVLEGLPERPPGRMYADDQESFASNEYAINWNAPLVCLLAGAADAELDRRPASR